MRRKVELRDPRALRAVAHPVRLALLSTLRRDGPLTATQAAERVGESPSSCSFHLRQLAKYGLVDDAGGGRGRERPWRATAMFTSWSDVLDDPDVAAAGEVLSAVVAGRYHERMQEWVARRRQEPAEWRGAVPFGDSVLYVTAAELAELERAIDALFEPYVERVARPERRPEGARPIGMLRVGYPLDDAPAAG